MKSKDQILLEEAYEQILLVESSSGQAPFGLWGFEAPRPKGKFQLDEIVKIEDPGNRWNKYQSDKSRQAINGTGKIVGYKYVAGSYSKYAVELPNGNIFGIHAHFLRPLTEKEKQLADLVHEFPEVEGVFQ